MSIVCVYMSAAVGDSDILPEIIVPPSPTSCTESVDRSIKIECVANARYLCRKEGKYGFQS